MRVGKETGNLLKLLVRLSAVGMELVVSILIGLGLGLLVDKYFKTSPWGMLAFL
ncbi:AtpZ/AtpI family protein [Thermosulfidibacter takaii]|uniref:AtpZ/AtpI family protein n=1 Tax=Thermosulfidibacter takaii TaxID=412593 RepID=UPI0009F86E05|nr:AtpZ/AtpI family protein [Thermosulfidibacter takaii]